MISGLCLPGKELMEVSSGEIMGRNSARAPRSQQEGERLAIGGGRRAMHPKKLGKSGPGKNNPFAGPMGIFLQVFERKWRVNF